MADFCKQCSENLFQRDTKDLADLGDPNEVLAEDEGYAVICEGCGPTLVNKAGECIATDCLVDHKTGEYRNI